MRKLILTAIIGALMVLPFETASAQTQVCARLERDLARLTSLQNSRANVQATRFADAVNQQQQNMGIMRRQLRRAGCSADPAVARGQGGQCPALADRMQAMERNLAELERRLSRMRGRDYTGEIEGVRRDLVRNRCGEAPVRVRTTPDMNRHPGDYAVDQRYPDTLARHPRGGLFNNFWGSSEETRLTPEQMEAIERAKQVQAGRSGTVRTICVRTCDGFYFPISFSTLRSNLEDDAAKCQAQCPGTEVKLFYHSNPGQDPEYSVAIDGTRYEQLENASRYQREFVSGCGCKTPDMMAGYETMSPRSDQPAELTLEQRLMALNNAPLPRRRGEAEAMDAEVAKALDQSAAGKVRVILSYPPIERKPWDAQLAGEARPAPARDPSL